MIKNLTQLKKTLTAGAKFIITEHCRTENIGQTRQITTANTMGFYSVEPDAPDSRVSQANNGKGSWLDWRAAREWEFREDGTCACYTGEEHTAETLVMAIRVEGEQ